MLKLAFETSPLMLECEYSGFAQTFLIDQKPFIPKIFDGPHEAFAEPFNTLVIRDEQAVPEGEALLLWEIPPEQISSFIDTVWPKFAHRTLGVLLYRGKTPPDLRTTIALFPDELVPFLAINFEHIDSPYEAFAHLSPTDFEFFHLIVKGDVFSRFPYARPFIGWGQGGSPYGFFGGSPFHLNPSNNIPLAIVPPVDTKLQSLFDQTAQKLEQQRTPFRVIPEEVITTSWEGVDTMIVFEKGLSPQGKRKIAGFSAAGGTLETL